MCVFAPAPRGAQNLAADEAVCAVSVLAGLLATLHVHDHLCALCRGLPGTSCPSVSETLSLCLSLSLSLPPSPSLYVVAVPGNFTGL